MDNGRLEEGRGMDLGIRGKVALVCGASKGLGKQVAMALAREGAKVALCAREGSALEKAAREISERFEAEVWFLPTDLSRPEEARRFARGALERFGTAHILVNNAGGPPSSSFMELEEEEWLDAFYLNFMSAVILTKEVIPSMLEQGWGRIVNLTSVAVKQPIEGLILSNAVRAAVHGWAKSLSNELASRGILVNCVCTGFMRTERVENLAKDMAEAKGVDKEEIIGNWEAQIPMGRLGRPEELADLVVFLASERASYITGTSIAIDGGYCKGLL
jgi:3-oxoacyl-[acyl-carrier protein] reductase